MKKLSTLFAVVAFLLAATFSAFAADNSYKVANGKVTVTITDLAPNAAGTALVACYNIDVAPNATDECASLLITPLVRDDKGNKKLIEMIVVNGESQKINEEWLQRVCYGVIDQNHVRFYTVREGEALHVKTCTEVPYEDWMDEDAAFYITTQKATYKPNCIQTAIAATPASSAIFATSTALICSASQPFLILTVTGFLGELSTIALRILPASSGSFIRALPSPFPATLGTGQPILKSIISKS